MRKIRVLIVDDSVVARRLLTDALSSDPSIEVTDVAATGRVALAKLPYCNPDAVTLDVDMPEMSGLETLSAIRKAHPRLPIIMVSNLTEHGAVVTLDALSLGATDYVTKPSDVRNRDAALQKLRDELLPVIKTFCRSAVAPEPAPPPPIANAEATVRSLLTTTGAADVVAIGISTGGPNALAEMLPLLPKNFPVPVLVVQHMPPIFTKFLSDRLASKCPMKVTEAVAGDVLEPGHVYIAPGDHHMLVERQGNEVRIQVNTDNPENSCRPSVDVLLRSVAKVYGGRALAVIMTGMGQDGLRGCERVKEAGGQVLAQDEASSVVWGMPGFVARAGLADRVLPLGQLPGEILRRVRATSPKPVAGGGAGASSPDLTMPISAKDFDFIRDLVRQRSAIVLDAGKEALVESRLSLLARREGAESMEELLRRLHAEGDGRLRVNVVEAMTTNETLFFRDIHPFEMLKNTVLPDLFQKRATSRALNVWSAGCSSGQEPYSFAILLKENFPQVSNWNIRLMACDLSNEMIARSREGRFSQFEVNRGLPAQILVKYFHQKGIDWQVREDVRRMVEFTQMNLAEPWPGTMPPMDIIFMRNVLIYFDLETKRTILAQARKLLRPDGYLFLGTAETTLNLDDNFDRVQNEKAWCYRPKKA